MANTHVHHFATDLKQTSNRPPCSGPIVQLWVRVVDLQIDDSKLHDPTLVELWTRKPGPKVCVRVRLASKESRDLLRSKFDRARQPPPAHTDPTHRPPSCGCEPSFPLCDIVNTSFSSSKAPASSANKADRNLVHLTSLDTS